MTHNLAHYERESKNNNLEDYNDPKFEIEFQYDSLGMIFHAVGVKSVVSWTLHHFSNLVHSNPFIVARKKLKKRKFPDNRIAVIGVSGCQAQDCKKSPIFSDLTFLTHCFCAGVVERWESTKECHNNPVSWAKLASSNGVNFLKSIFCSTLVASKQVSSRCREATSTKFVIQSKFVSIKADVCLIDSFNEIHMTM